MRVSGAVALSILGFGIHTVREFDWTGLSDPASGFLPVAVVQLALLAWWWTSPAKRPRAATYLIVIGWFQLVGGAIVSVLPLPFLPFAPAQTVDHYVSHAIFGLMQIPLILIPRGGLAGAPSARYP